MTVNAEEAAGYRYLTARSAYPVAKIACCTERLDFITNNFLPRVRYFFIDKSNPSSTGMGVMLYSWRRRRRC